jgi:hypothetical protein
MYVNKVSDVYCTCKVLRLQRLWSDMRMKGSARYKHAQSAQGSKILSAEADMLIDQHEYLELKALLVDEESEVVLWLDGSHYFHFRSHTYSLTLKCK